MSTHASLTAPSASLTRHLPRAATLLLGLIFVTFGLNGFLGFMPNPPLPEAAGAFMGALAKTGYMFPLIKGTEVVAGALLLGGVFVPLALLLLAPLVVNIVAFHVALAPGGMAVAGLVLALMVYLAWAYRESFRGVLATRAQTQPSRSTTTVTATTLPARRAASLA
jgi:uncharacterized membrane protein YphA (DoxX/SURF4 family)